MPLRCFPYKIYKTVVFKHLIVYMQVSYTQERKSTQVEVHILPGFLSVGNFQMVVQGSGAQAECSSLMEQREERSEL